MYLPMSILICSAASQTKITSLLVQIDDDDDDGLHWMYVRTYLPLPPAGEEPVYNYAASGTNINTETSRRARFLSHNSTPTWEMEGDDLS